MSDPKGKPDSLDALFKAKAKKKPKAMNLNAAAEKPPPPAPKPLRSPTAEAGDGGQGEGWERALKRDQELLKACGLWIKEVEADGACLFRAFCDQMNGDGGKDHASFRERCVDFMQGNREDFEPFLEEDFAEYCARMRRPSTWGGHVEAQALARCEGVSALIYRPAEAGEPQALSATSVEILSSGAEDARCVQLSFHPTHHAGQHYNSVRCVTDEGEGPSPAASLAELRRRIEDALRPPAASSTPAEEPEEEASGAGARQRKKVFF